MRFEVYVLPTKLDDQLSHRARAENIGGQIQEVYGKAAADGGRIIAGHTLSVGADKDGTGERQGVSRELVQFLFLVAQFDEPAEPRKRTIASVGGKPSHGPYKSGSV